MRALSRDEKKRIIKASGGSKEHILSILLALQKSSEQGLIDEDTIRLVSEMTGFTILRIKEIIHFYAMFNQSQEACHVIKICRSNPCSLGREEDIAGILFSLLGIKVGEVTEDGQFSLKYMPCAGACDIGPVVQIGDELYGDLTREKLESMIAQLNLASSKEAVK